MNLIVAIPLQLRLAALLVVGVCVGGLINLAVYRLAWHPRSISPLSRPDPQAPRRRRADRLPVIGWLGLRREAALHGTGFWIRPMLLELLAGIGFAALYWWEIERLGLLLPQKPPSPAMGLLAVLHTQYAVHVLLMSLMLAASVIDVDERIIPDAITVPGTILGLLLATACPWSMLHSVVPPPAGNVIRPDFWNGLLPDHWPFLQLAWPLPPNNWPPWLGGAGGLAIALACWWLWCVALMPRSWYSRHGYRRAMQLSLARLCRESATYRILGMGTVGSLAVAGVWLWGDRAWVGLLSGLVGMAAGGGIIWIVRILGTAVLRREAMGFGDVILMAMIGAFLGWQPCLVVFFLAPFAGLVIGLFQVVLLRDSQIPYGPFLCAAATATIVGWATIWERTWDIFAMGNLVPLFVLFCLLMMVPLLGLIVLARRAFAALRGANRSQWRH